MPDPVRAAPTRARRRARPDPGHVHARRRPADGPRGRRHRRRPAAHGHRQAAERARRRGSRRGAVAAGLEDATSPPSARSRRDFSRTNYPGMPNGQRPRSHGASTRASSASTPPACRASPTCPPCATCRSPRTDPQVAVHDGRVLGPVRPGRQSRPTSATRSSSNDNVTRPYTFGRAVNVNSGNSGVISSAACTGVCGNLPVGARSTSSCCSTGRAAWTTRTPSTTSAPAPSRCSRPSIRRSSASRSASPGPSSQTRTSGGYYGQKSLVGARSTRARRRVPTPTRCTRSHSTRRSRRRATCPNYLGAYQNANNANGLDDSIIRHSDGRHQRRRLPAGLDHGRRRQQRQHPDAERLERSSTGPTTASNVGVATYYRFATNRGHVRGQLDVGHHQQHPRRRHRRPLLGRRSRRPDQRRGRGRQHRVHDERDRHRLHPSAPPTGTPPSSACSRPTPATPPTPPTTSR